MFARCADLLVLVVHLKALPNDAIRGDVLPHLREMCKSTEETTLVDHLGEALDVVDVHRWER